MLPCNFAFRHSPRRVSKPSQPVNLANSVPTRLTRPDFDVAASELLKRAREDATSDQRDDDVLGPHLLRKSWQWKEHQSYPGFGYLQRAVVTRLMAPTTLIDDGEGDHDLLEVQDIEQDPSAVVTNGDARDNCTVTFSICLSPTYRVPVLYFTAHKSTGTPLTLDELVASSIFYRRSSTITYPLSTLAPPDSSLDLTDIAPPAPFLSQRDHPTLGTPSWFVHPCETETIMSEVLQNFEKGEVWQGNWLESWLMVIGSVCDLRE